MENSFFAHLALSVIKPNGINPDTHFAFAVLDNLIAAVNFLNLLYFLVLQKLIMLFLFRFCGIHYSLGYSGVSVPVPRYYI